MCNSGGIRPHRLLRAALGLVLLMGSACGTSPGDRRRAKDAPPAVSQAEQPSLTMDLGQREYLWQIEHDGLVLAKYGFSRLKETLARADSSALLNLLTEDFSGAVFRNPRTASETTSFLSVVRSQESADGRTSLNRVQFVEQLLSYRQLFHAPPRVAVSLMKLSPAEQGNLDSPRWQGSCLLRMWGEYPAGQPTEVVLMLEFTIPRPSEENLTDRPWLHQAAIVQSLVGQSKGYLFREAARARGIDPANFQDNWLVPDTRERKGVTGGIYVCDFDRDGRLDLMITDTHGYFLYKGQPGGKFTDVTEQMGIPRKPAESLPCTIMAAFVDLDGDGWEDLILGRRVFRNENGRRFVDQTFGTNLRVPIDAGGVVLADFDRDGLVDLYVTRSGKDKKDSWLGGKSGDTQGNFLFRNKGQWQFEDVTAAAKAGGGLRSTFTAVWLDANNDGWPDLHVINEFGDGVLLVNGQNGSFREHSLAPGPNDFGTMGVTAGDIDNDGNIDIYCGNMYSKAGMRVMANVRPGTYPEEIMAKMRQFVAGSQLWHNRGNLAFEKLGSQCQVAAAGWAYGPAFADIDNDGYLDLYATAGYMSQSRDDPDG